ncbi:hypothetical protein A5627_03725 [Mycobacterium colombiense]|nr:hypothetical protein A5627_03725 [Mycobacterium colombiense]
MVCGGPPHAVAVTVADQHQGFAHRHRLVAADRDDTRPEEVRAALGHQLLMGLRADHRVYFGAAFHAPAVDVVHAVGRPQSRGGVGIAGVDRGAV